MSRPVEAIRFESVSLTSIRIDGGTQVRDGLDMDHVQHLAEKIEKGRSLTPPEARFDGASYWLTDGFHRIAAYKARGITEVRIAVRDGDLEDARIDAAGANDEDRAKPRTNADKRRAVEMLIATPRCSEWSNRRFAEVAKVSESTVRNVRRLNDSAELDDGAQSAHRYVTPRKHVSEGRDGVKQRSEGQRAQGTKRAFENAVAKMGAAPDTASLETAYAAVTRLAGDGRVSPEQVDEVSRVMEVRVRELSADPIPRAPRPVVLAVEVVAGAPITAAADENPIPFTEEERRYEKMRTECRRFETRMEELLRGCHLSKMRNPSMRADLSVSFERIAMLFAKECAAVKVARVA